MKNKKRIKPNKETSEIVATDNGSPLDGMSDWLTEFAMKAIEEADPMTMWKLFSIKLMEANDWDEEDLKAEVDKLLSEEPTVTGKSKSPNRQARRGKR